MTDPALPPEVIPAGDPDDPWRIVLAQVAAEKPALAACLARSASRGEEDRMLRVRVPGLQAFQREQLERKQNREYLLGLIEKAFGRPMGVRFVNEPDDDVAGAAPLAGDSASRARVLGAAGSSGEIGAPRAGASAAGGLPAGGSQVGGSQTGGSPVGRARPQASPDRIRKIADLFGGDVIGSA